MLTGSIRLHVQPALEAGARIEASRAQTHYLANVMRQKAGAALRLFDGQTGEWQGRIESLARGRAVLVVEARLRPQSGEPDLWLAFAPLKRDATDLVVQKATELGCAAILPVFTARTNTTRVAEQRLASIATEAAEQSERLTVPSVRPACTLADLLSRWPRSRPLFAAIERGPAPFLRGSPGPAGLLVGPEGGFTPGELDLLARHAFVRPASLGPRILRAETAAIAGLALLQVPIEG